MKKSITAWTISRLATEFASIDFPEYQREPTVWSRSAKQRLVDSILRQFDIASLYFYRDDDGTLDCIDGRQRIGAIMSFLAKNESDVEDNGFRMKGSNEIYQDDQPPFAEFEGATYADVMQKAGEGNELAQKFLTALNEYPLSIVELSGSRRSEEFNLQFIRLNVGTIINSGEKLHAMVGEVRDQCFKQDGLGHHRFFDGINITTRRYSKEQVAAQILTQVFSIRKTKEYTRTRHFDLQRFFKENSTIDEAGRAWIKEVSATLDALAEGFEDAGVLRNRAITVSTVLLAWQQKVTPANARAFAAFIGEFLCRLSWQVGRVRKGLDVDSEYRYLLDFQRHVTQASVEKPAVVARAEMLEKLYGEWNSRSTFPGDKEYTKRTGVKPDKACREAKSA